MPGAERARGLAAGTAPAGVGRELLRQVEMLVAAHGYQTVGLGVATGNPDAARLYRCLGYTMQVQRYVDH